MPEEVNQRGWIKLHRRLKNKGFYKNSSYVHLWVHLLLSANHKAKEFMFNGKIIIIKEGQLLTGRKQLAEATGLSESMVERALTLFENEQQIEQQKTTKNRVITILKWYQYQISDNETDSKRTTTEQRADTNKNDKNEENEKKKTTTMVEADFSDIEQYLLQEWGREGRVGWSIITDFIDLGKKYGKEKLYDAIKTAAHANIKNFRYVKGILNGGGSKNGSTYHTNEMPFEKHNATNTILTYTCKNGHENKASRSEWQKHVNQRATCTECDAKFAVNDVLKQIPTIDQFLPKTG